MFVYSLVNDILLVYLYTHAVYTFIYKQERKILFSEFNFFCHVLRRKKDKSGIKQKKEINSRTIFLLGLCC